MRTINRCVVAAAAFALVASLETAAKADHESLVAAGVTEVMTVNVGGGVARRAITGADERGVFLVIEELQRGQIVSQQRLASAVVGGQRIELERYGRRIKLDGWERDNLSFTVGRGEGRLRCVVDLRHGNEAQCRGRIARGNLPYHGDASQTQINAAIRACSSAIEDYVMRDRCVRAVVDSRYEAGGLAAACEAGFDGDGAELGCIEAGV